MQKESYTEKGKCHVFMKRKTWYVYEIKGLEVINEVKAQMRNNQPDQRKCSDSQPWSSKVLNLAIVHLIFIQSYAISTVNGIHSLLLTLTQHA